ncbi:hypothetical protein [Polyangium mundeleinium]|uniref:Uncharacterized protein n=1 Tax=Polyangium mundeleinium TaxID=2995306 RepID=A0ABT5F8C8_9BACT|nr:hypothetical protein [Polyangium mundeleinium]MDC0749919.1 hypothetical protein [Polyangium mundeleinium]
MIDLVEPTVLDPDEVVPELFMAEGRSVKGSVEGSDPTKETYGVGMPVWVLYVPGNLAMSSIWPPVR